MTFAAPAWRQVSARVCGRRDCGADHWWLDLELPSDFPLPEPGQFVQLLLSSFSSAAFLPRPMSVAGARRDGDRWVLGFLFARVGTGTRALASLPSGASVEVLGPLGRGFPLDREGTAVLLAGGRGVAPLLFAADTLAARGRRCEFLFGARDRDHLVGLEEARARIEAAGGRLHLCTDDGSLGLSGDVVSLLERVSARFPRPLAIYACGPHSMLRSVARWSEVQEEAAFVAMESVMACGTGVCRGCPLPRSASGRTRFGSDVPSLYGNRDFAMCCTEGPVFAARDLDWMRIE